MEGFFRDLRFGARMLLRAPGVTAVALLALALGIGANTALFSVVYAALVRPLPVKDEARLVTVVLASRRLNADGAQPGFSTYARLKEQGRSFDGIAAAAVSTAAFSNGAADDTVKFWRITQSFLPLMGVSPALGRNFTAEEDQPGAARVALVSDRFWRRKLNANPRVLGSDIALDGARYTVIGVLPAGFHVNGRPADVYAAAARGANARDWLPVDIYARLKAGVTVSQAQAELDALAAAREPHPLGWHERVYRLRDFQVRDVRLSLAVLLGAVGLVLLIGCSNTAMLLLARASSRRKEMAMRSALGAGLRRLFRQSLTESVLLALAGGAGGLLVARACLALLPLLDHERLPGLLQQSRLDSGVLLFTLAVALLTGLIFGSAPAFAAARLNVFETLKEGGCAGTSAARRRTLDFLVAGEIALAVVLTIGASLLIRTFFYLRDVAPGFTVDSLVTARITPPRGKFTSREQCNAYWKELFQRVRAIPGVRAASFAQAIPLDGEVPIMNWPVEGVPAAGENDLPLLIGRHVETDYFRVMQIPLRRGRLFTERDDAAAPKVVIVNEALARRFWPGQEPLGKHLGGGFGVPLFEVAGVVGDVRSEDSTRNASPEVYLHFLQGPTGRLALAIRPDPRVYRNPLAIEPAVRRVIAAYDPTLPPTRFLEMRHVISERIASNRLSAQLIGVFAGLALVLAAAGIYGVLSFSVARRTPEIGVRMALGADRARVLALVLRQAIAPALVGVALGIAAALGLTQVIRSLLHGVGAMNPLVYASSAALLLAVAVLAALAPAWRATRVDPLIALRAG